jgi:hypothetical protein
MSKDFLLINRCTKTRVKTADDHTLKVFSAFYQHPRLLEPEGWTLLNMGDDKILVDVDTIHLLDQHECELGYEPKTGTILTCKITPKHTEDLDKHWDEILQYCLKVKEDFAKFCDVSNIKSDPLPADSDSSNDDHKLENAPIEIEQIPPSIQDEDLK